MKITLFSLIALSGAEAVKVMMAPTELAIENSFIVALRPEYSNVPVETLLTNSMKEVIIRQTWGPGSVLPGFVGYMSPQTANELAKDKRIKSIEQNARVYANDITWGLDRTDQRGKMLDNSYSPSFGDQGTGVTSYIIDTGIRTSHNDFGTRASWGVNTIDSTNDDCNGHGTHVAGTVGGLEWGMAKNATLVAVKVLNCEGDGSWDSVIAGINWVKNNAKLPAVANMSLGGSVNSAINEAVANLSDSGVVVVVAAGNSNNNACENSPASEPKAITVAASTSSDQRAYFSSFGPCVDIFAPGFEITSTWKNSDYDTKTISGTSMASPHVCGAATLLLASEPGLNAADVADRLFNYASKNIVVNTGSSTTPNRMLYVGPLSPPTTSSPTSSKAPSQTPSRVPTVHPAISPPPSLAPIPCSGYSFKLSITTDWYPTETAWKLVRVCNGADTLVSIPEGYYENAEALYEHSHCLPFASYMFIISDSFGDGICCSWGSGSYLLIVDGGEVFKGGLFGRKEETEFGICPAPTSFPSDIPSLVPVSTPSTIPSDHPTSTPLAIPSSKPSVFPSSVPSVTVSKSPSENPSLLPSKFPSHTPSVTPSTIPTVLNTTSCKEDPHALFYIGKASKRKTCAWLATRGKKAKKKFCKLAVVCWETCELFKKFDRGDKFLPKSCLWLAQPKQDQKRNHLCSTSAKNVCHKVCGSCPEIYE